METGDDLYEIKGRWNGSEEVWEDLQHEIIISFNSTKKVFGMIVNWVLLFIFLIQICILKPTPVSMILDVHCTTNNMYGAFGAFICFVTKRLYGKR